MSAAIGDGAPTYAINYDSYGRRIFMNRLTPANRAVSDPFFFYTARPFDSGTGLINLRARWYDPNTGTFTSEDPEWQPNLYMYVENNPLKYVDPWGMKGKNESFVAQVLHAPITVITPVKQALQQGIENDIVESLVYYNDISNPVYKRRIALVNPDFA